MIKKLIILVSIVTILSGCRMLTPKENKDFDSWKKRKELIEAIPKPQIPDLYETVK